MKATLLHISELSFYLYDVKSTDDSRLDDYEPGTNPYADIAYVISKNTAEDYKWINIKSMRNVYWDLSALDMSIDDMRRSMIVMLRKSKDMRCTITTDQQHILDRYRDLLAYLQPDGGVMDEIAYSVYARIVDDDMRIKEAYRLISDAASDIDSAGATYRRLRAKVQSYLDTYYFC